jgi:hypothetical protein
LKVLGLGKKWKYLKSPGLAKEWNLFLKVPGFAKKWKYFEIFGVGKKMEIFEKSGLAKNEIFF